MSVVEVCQATSVGNVKYRINEFCDVRHQHYTSLVCLCSCVAIIYYNGRRPMDVSNALVPLALGCKRIILVYRSKHQNVITDVNDLKVHIYA